MEAIYSIVACYIVCYRTTKHTKCVCVDIYTTEPVSEIVNFGPAVCCVRPGSGAHVVAPFPPLSRSSVLSRIQGRGYAYIGSL